MLKKIIFVLAALTGATIGVLGVWIFHFIIEANAPFLTHHRWLAACVGAAGLLIFANIVYETRNRHPRTYGLFVLGIACGIFMQAIFYFPDVCPDACNTDFVLKLGACVILMVDGFASVYRKPANESATTTAKTGQG